MSGKDAASQGGWKCDSQAVGALGGALLCMTDWRARAESRARDAAQCMKSPGPGWTSGLCEPKF